MHLRRELLEGDRKSAAKERKERREESKPRGLTDISRGQGRHAFAAPGDGWKKRFIPAGVDVIWVLVTGGWRPRQIPHAPSEGGVFRLSIRNERPSLHRLEFMVFTCIRC